MKAKTLLFRGNPWWGSFFAGSALRTALCFSAASLVLLILPAWILNLPADGGVPFVTKKPNWSLMYPIVIPIILGGMVSVCMKMRRALIQLIKTEVILPQGGKTRTSFLYFVSDSLSGQSRRLLQFSVTVTVIIMAVDTWDVWLGYWNSKYFDRGWDWETAFIQWPKAFRFPDHQVKLQDFVLTLVAYSFQAAVCLVACYWVGKYWQFLRCVAEVIRGRNPDYKFNPLLFEPKHRFGLFPLAPLFNAFLILTVAFQVFGLGHRLQQHEHYRHTSAIEYVQGLFEADTKSKAAAPKEAGEKKEFEFSVAGMLNLTKRDYSFDTLLHTSTILPIILTTIPFVVISFLPLGVIYSTLEKYRDKEYDKNSRALDTAKGAGRKDQADIYLSRLEALDKANIWPNGDLTGWAFLCLIVALSVGAWLPPVLVYFVAAGGAIWAWKVFRKLRAGGKEP